jgi:hypothetical protein
MAKGDKQDVMRAKKLVKSGAGDPKAPLVRGASGKYSSKDILNQASKKAPKSVSATKPSVASKANAKNKMKAQGAKIGSSATSGYGKKGKK